MTDSEWTQAALGCFERAVSAAERDDPVLCKEHTAQGLDRLARVAESE